MSAAIVKRTPGKYTPGPWKCNVTVSHADGLRPESKIRPGYVLNEEGLTTPEIPICEAYANAALIAAAPELLEALKLARKCIDYCRKAHKDIQSGDGIPVETFLDAAIDKAEGGAA